MKRTNMTTYEYGKSRRVFQDTDGRLYFRKGGRLYGTSTEYCTVEDHGPAEGWNNKKEVTA